MTNSLQPSDLSFDTDTSAEQISLSKMSSPVPRPPPKIEAGLTVSSSSSDYMVLEIMGEGSFGKVARCRNLATEADVAIKFVKDKLSTQAEASMLESLSVLDVDQTNILKFFEQFDDQGLTCLAFEMLDRSLYDWLEDFDFTPLLLESIRPIAKQLFVALDALRVVGILHTDIKPDNIMFVNVKDQPLRVKLIDFGNAYPVAAVCPGMTFQALAYRAPEILLGLPFNEAIDVWGVGCVLVFLYLGNHLFPYGTEYELMRAIVQLVGQPEDHLLHAGMYTQRYFCKEEAAGGPSRRIMTPEEYAAANHLYPKTTNDMPSSLDYLVHLYDKDEEAEFEDRLVFVDLLKQLLHVDPDKRISPQEALQHPFITMEHLRQIPDSRAYLDDSQATMSRPWIRDGHVPHVLHQDPDVCIPGDEDAAKGAEPPGFAPDVSASTSRPKKFLGRVRRVFKWIMTPFSCCWRPRV